jgi:hypothetical protein
VRVSRSSWKRGSVRLLAYVLVGLVATVALAWFPEVVPWSLRAQPTWVAWIEQRGGAYWVVSLSSRGASAVGYPSESRAQKLLARMISAGGTKAPDGAPPPLPAWALVRQDVITKSMMMGGTASEGWALVNDGREGWPFAALGGGRAEHMGPGYTTVRVRNDHVLKLGEHEVPTRPLWPGLLANTAIFGVVAWTVHAAATPIVRRVRARLRPGPGMCARCRYDRRGLAAGAACPECGAA